MVDVGFAAELKWLKSQSESMPGLKKGSQKVCAMARKGCMLKLGVEMSGDNGT